MFFTDKTLMPWNDIINWILISSVKSSINEKYSHKNSQNSWSFCLQQSKAIFFFEHTHISSSSRTIYFLTSFRNILKFRSKLLNPINNRYMTDSHQSFDSSKSIALQIIFNSFLLNMIRITIPATSVIASTTFTLVSLFPFHKSILHFFFFPTFWAFLFFYHSFILSYLFCFCNAYKPLSNSKSFYSTSSISLTNSLIILTKK